MRDHMWFIFLAAFALGLILFFGGLAGAEPTWKGLVKDAARKQSRGPSWTTNNNYESKKKAWECHIVGRKWIRTKKGSEQVPITRCEEK